MIISADTVRDTPAELRAAAELLLRAAAEREGGGQRPLREVPASAVPPARVLPVSPVPDSAVAPVLEVYSEDFATPKAAAMATEVVREQRREQEKESEKPQSGKPIVPKLPSGVQLY